MPITNTNYSEITRHDEITNESNRISKSYEKEHVLSRVEKMPWCMPTIDGSDDDDNHRKHIQFLMVRGYA